jgi:MarR family 2-MHQ and catechol resistance regulon transcriptional repressor
MVETSRDRALKLWVVLNRAFAAIAEHSRADVQRSGLSPMEFAALEALYHKGPLLIGGLQEKVLMSSGGMTYVVDQLEKKGLVERRPCAEDRRARYVALTEEGQALMDRLFPKHAEQIERALAGLEADEQDRAIDLLRKLGQAAAALPTGPMKAGSAGREGNAPT